MDQHQPGLSAEALETIYDAKSRTELDDADTAAGAGPESHRGAAGATVMALVGGVTPEDVRAGGPVSGEAGEALGKALAALGVESDASFVLATRPARASAAARVRRLSLAIEAVDPRLVLALDAAAAEDLAAALGVPELEQGRPLRVLGRLVGSVGDFRASLADERAKRAVWSAMRTLAAASGLKAAGRPKAPRKDVADAAGS